MCSVVVSSMSSNANTWDDYIQCICIVVTYLISLVNLFTEYSELVSLLNLVCLQGLMAFLTREFVVPWYVPWLPFPSNFQPWWMPMDLYNLYTIFCILLVCTFVSCVCLAVTYVYAPKKDGKPAFVPKKERDLPTEITNVKNLFDPPVGFVRNASPLAYLNPITVIETTHIRTIAI